METSIKEIYEHRPCAEGFTKLINGIFGKDLPEQNIVKTKEVLTEEEFNQVVSIKQILEINGVEDAFWALRTQDYKDYCLVLADVAESVLPIFEEKYPEDKRPREAIEAIRKYHKGEISKEELREAARAADAAAAAAADAAARAARAAAADTALATAASAYAAARAADAAYTAALALAYAALALAASADAAARADQWKKNEQILRRYL